MFLFSCLHFLNLERFIITILEQVSRYVRGHLFLKGYVIIWCLGPYRGICHTGSKGRIIRHMITYEFGK